MSIDATTIREVRVSGFGQVPAWLWLGVGLYAYLLVASSGLLNDSDTYWQIAVGQWILDRGAMPRVDVYSFSMPGEAWISSSWLAQVLYAASYNLAGWAGPVAVAAGGSLRLSHCWLISWNGAFRRPMRSWSRWRPWCCRCRIFWRVRTCW